MFIGSAKTGMNGKWQYLLATFLLCFQFFAAFNSGVHAAAADKYACGEYALPVEVQANIRALLLLQGDLDEDDKSVCELACAPFNIEYQYGSVRIVADRFELFYRTAFDHDQLTCSAPWNLRYNPRDPPFSTY